MLKLERLNVVYETDDEVRIEALKAKGFVVVGGATQKKTGSAASEPDIDWNKMSVKELRAYAEEHGIDISGVDRKEEIIAVIEGE